MCDSAEPQRQQHDVTTQRITNINQACKMLSSHSANPTGSIKLAHQFWFSYPPPGAGGGSSNSKTSQTDEEKQRDRQRNEREAKKEEQDAINYKRDKEAREARLLDFEIRRQQKREEQKQHQLHQQQGSETSPPTTSSQLQQKQQQQTQQQQQPSSPHDRSLPPAFRSRSIEREIIHDRKRYSASETAELKEQARTTPSPQAFVEPPPPIQSAVVAGPPATAAAATAAIIPILPLGVATLRDDSTESEQSVTCSQAQPDAFHRIM